MAVGNVELMHECFPEHLDMGTARMKQVKETKGKKSGVSMDRSKAGRKKEVPTSYLPPTISNYKTNEGKLTK